MLPLKLRPLLFDIFVRARWQDDFASTWDPEQERGGLVADKVVLPTELTRVMVFDLGEPVSTSTGVRLVVAPRLESCCREIVSRRIGGQSEIPVPPNFWLACAHTARMQPSYAGMAPFRGEFERESRLATRCTTAGVAVQLANRHPSARLLSRPRRPFMYHV